MTLRTVGSLIGAANGAKDLQAMAVNFYQNYRRYANGVADIKITDTRTPPQPCAPVAPCRVGGCWCRRKSQTKWRTLGSLLSESSFKNDLTGVAV